MRKILVTGSTGYIGSALVSNLVRHAHYELVLPVREVSESVTYPCHQVLIKDIGDVPSSVFDQVDVVVHLAAKAHDLSGSQELLNEIGRVNLDVTKELAKAALSAGVKKFIFLSSVGVCGNATEQSAFTEESTPHPQTSYAIAKRDAEDALNSIVDGSTMELVIVRPPLVYDGGAPGNFGRLLRLVSLGLPLPFGNSRNNRSIIALENLVDFIRTCIEHPSSGGNLFLVSDGQDVSTEDIVRYLAQGMQRRVFLFPVPHKLLRTLASWFGRGHLYSQLFGSLTLNSDKARETLSWVPPSTAKDALVRSGQKYARTLSRLK